MKKIFLIGVLFLFIPCLTQSTENADTLINKINDSVSSAIIIKPGFDTPEIILIKNPSVVHQVKDTQMPRGAKWGIIGLAVLVIVIIYPLRWLRRRKYKK